MNWQRLTCSQKAPARSGVRSALLPCVLGLCACLLPACASTISPRITNAKFPEDVARGETLDVQVTRSTTHISLTNTSSRMLSAGTLWLNMRFSRAVDQLAPGQSMTLDLREFRDDLGDTFRAGGFFSKEKPDPVVLAQWQTDGQMLGLVAIAEEAK